MSDQRFFLVKYTIIILFFLPSLFYSLNKNLIRQNGFYLSGLSQKDSKDIQSSFDEAQDSGLPSSASDLMNILQRIEAMNTGTEPYDAIDDALKAFEGEDLEESFFDSDFDSDLPGKNLKIK